MYTVNASIPRGMIICLDSPFLALYLRGSVCNTLIFRHIFKWVSLQSTAYQTSCPPLVKNTDLILTISLPFSSPTSLQRFTRLVETTLFLASYNSPATLSVRPIKSLLLRGQSTKRASPRNARPYSVTIPSSSNLFIPATIISKPLSHSLLKARMSRNIERSTWRQGDTARS